MGMHIKGWFCNLANYIKQLAIYPYYDDKVDSNNNTLIIHNLICENTFWTESEHLYMSSLIFFLNSHKKDRWRIYLLLKCAIIFILNTYLCFTQYTFRRVVLKENRLTTPTIYILILLGFIYVNNRRNSFASSMNNY